MFKKDKILKTARYKKGMADMKNDRVYHAESIDKMLSRYLRRIINEYTTSF